MPALRYLPNLVVPRSPHEELAAGVAFQDEWHFALSRDDKIKASSLLSLRKPIDQHTLFLICKKFPSLIPLAGQNYPASVKEIFAYVSVHELQGAASVIDELVRVGASLNIVAADSDIPVFEQLRSGKLGKRMTSEAFPSSKRQQVGSEKYPVPDDINAVDESGKTVLDHALDERKYGYAMFLLERGADPSIGFQHWDFLSDDVTQDSAALLRLFVSKGADINAKDKGGMIAIENAVKSKRYDWTKVLLENGAEASVGFQHWDFLSEKVTPDTIALLQLFVSKGAAINTDKGGQNILESAVWAKKYDWGRGDIRRLHSRTA